MKHKLSEIINTDCYVQFDSNEQLRKWVKEAGIKIWGGISNANTLIRLSDGMYTAISKSMHHYPIHHHTNISI
jgi:hypothetical protein